MKTAMERINALMPKGEIIPIHNINAYPVVDKYKVKCRSSSGNGVRAQAA